jgi:hypothetical protein
MKILKPGTLPVREPEVWRGTCHNCGCMVELDGNEVKQRPHSLSADGSSSVFKCPQQGCPEAINLKLVVFRDGQEIIPPRGGTGTVRASASRATPRYLVFNVDKHQHDVELKDEYTDADKDNADNHYNVIVDLRERKAYMGGVWKECDVR